MEAFFQMSATLVRGLAVLLESSWKTVNYCSMGTPINHANVKIMNVRVRTVKQ